MSRKVPLPQWVSLCAPAFPAVEPGEPAMPICGTDPTPPAKVVLLAAADLAVLRAGFGGYAQAGHMVDGADATGGRNIHRCHIVWAPGTKFAIMWATRCGTNTGTAQSDSKVGDDATFPANHVAQSPFLGDEDYLETGTTQVSVQHIHTGTAKSGSAATMCIENVPTAAPVVGLHEIRYAHGFCIKMVEPVADMETL
jgi:hypothetical protein